MNREQKMLAKLVVILTEYNILTYNERIEFMKRIKRMSI
jgi:hypothetical protein